MIFFSYQTFGGRADLIPIYTHRLHINRINIIDNDKLHTFTVISSLKHNINNLNDLKFGIK